MSSRLHVGHDGPAILRRQRPVVRRHPVLSVRHDFEHLRGAALRRLTRRQRRRRGPRHVGGHHRRRRCVLAVADGAVDVVDMAAPINGTVCDDDRSIAHRHGPTRRRAHARGVRVRPFLLPHPLEVERLRARAGESDGEQERDVFDHASPSPTTMRNGLSGTRSRVTCSTVVFPALSTTENRSTLERSKPSISNSGCQSRGSRSNSRNPRNTPAVASRQSVSKVAGTKAAAAWKGRPPMFSGYDATFAHHCTTYPAATPVSPAPAASNASGNDPCGACASSVVNGNGARVVTKRSSHIPTSPAIATPASTLRFRRYLRNQRTCGTTTFSTSIAQNSHPNGPAGQCAKYVACSSGSLLYAAVENSPM